MQRGKEVLVPNKHIACAPTHILRTELRHRAARARSRRVPSSVRHMVTLAALALSVGLGGRGRVGPPGRARVAGVFLRRQGGVGAGAARSVAAEARELIAQV